MDTDVNIWRQEAVSIWRLLYTIKGWGFFLKWGIFNGFIWVRGHWSEYYVTQMLVWDFDLHPMIQLLFDSPHLLSKWLTGANPLTCLSRCGLTSPWQYLFNCDQLPPGPVIHQPASLTDTDSDNDWFPERSVTRSAQALWCSESIIYRWSLLFCHWCHELTLLISKPKTSSK